jgi:hypothetical protein
MKHIKKFESFEDDIKDCFLNIIDLGFTYELYENYVFIYKKGTVDLIEFNSELNISLSRIKDNVTNIEYIYDAFKCEVKISFKMDYEFNIFIKQDDRTIDKVTLNLISLNDVSPSHRIILKVIDQLNKKTTFNIRVYGIQTFHKKSKNNNGLIELEYNNRKRGVFMEKDEFIKLINYISNKYEKDYSNFLKSVELIDNKFITN